MPVVASFILQFLFAGSVLFLVAGAVARLPLSLYPTFVAIFTISWLAGYLTFLTPAGLGVQEVSMATLLSFYLLLPVAGIVAVVFRVCLMLAEGTAVFFAWCTLGKGS